MARLASLYRRPISPVDLKACISFFAFYMPAGVLLSYLPLYLFQKGLEPGQVAVVFSSVFAVKLLTGPALTLWADRIGHHGLYLPIASLLTALSALVLYAYSHWMMMFACVIVISICRNYSQGVLEAVATSRSSVHAKIEYGTLRAIGSVAVCVGVLLFGGLWAAGSAYQQVALPVMLIACSVALSMSLRYTNNWGPETSAKQVAKPVVDITKDGRLLLYGGATLLVGANGVFYSAATNLLIGYGLSSESIAALWMTAFATEAAGFAIYDRIRKRVPLSAFFLLVVSLSVLRWILLYRSQSIGLLIPVFMLHVASFSWCHAMCVNWVRESSGVRYAATAQAFYIASAHGIGMACAAYVAGLYQERIGSGVFLVAALMTVSGASILAVRLFKTGKRPA